MIRDMEMDRTQLKDVLVTLKSQRLSKEDREEKAKIKSLVACLMMEAHEKTKANAPGKQASKSGESGEQDAKRAADTPEDSKKSKKKVRKEEEQ